MRLNKNVLIVLIGLIGLVQAASALESVDPSKGGYTRIAGANDTPVKPPNGIVRNDTKPAQIATCTVNAKTSVLCQCNAADYSHRTCVPGQYCVQEGYSASCK